MEALVAGSQGTVSSARISHLTARKALLVCGIVSPPLYIATDILGALRWQGYSYIDGPVSELIATGAPTRPLVGALMLLYSALAIAFGLGVWGSAGPKRSLRFVGGGLIAKEILGSVVVLLAPIHLRGVEGTLADTMHGLLTMAGGFCYLIAIGFGAAAFGKRFRLYSIATMPILPVFGGLAGLNVARYAANLPTPFMGVAERVNIFATMLWIVVLAVALWRQAEHPPKPGA